MSDSPVQFTIPSKYPKEVRWDTPLHLQPVHDILKQTAKNFGQRPAFDFLGKKWNWEEINDLVNRVALGLQNYGVTRGKNVGLFLPNSPYFLICYYGILRAGGTVVNYNPLYAEKELEYQIENSKTDIMVTCDLDMLVEKMDKALSNTRLERLVICPFADILPFPKNVLFKVFKGKEIAKIEKENYKERYIHWDKLIQNSGTPDHLSIDIEKDVAVLQYTGGTTGVPKGAVLTHANISANIEQGALWFYKAQEGNEKMLGVLPFFHVFAMTTVMNVAVKNAFEIIALPRFDLEQALKIIDKKKPHYFPAVPAIYSAINNHPKAKKYDLTSLRYCISGGAPLPVEVKQEFEENTGCVVVEGYGLTEASPIVCANPIEGLNKPGSIGMPMPGTVIEIINRDDQKTPMPQGERGELCVIGPQVMREYWEHPEDTKKTLINGRLHTGDVAVIDEDGYVFIVDRIKDLIITNGYNVYPRHVEEAIYQHPSVEECIVAGIPDEERGEIVKAWIKAKDGRTLSKEDVKEFLEDKLSKIEIPRRIEIRDKPLPKTMIGKLSRKEILKEEAQ